MANVQFGSVVAPIPAARVSVAADPGGFTCQWNRPCTARPCRRVGTRKQPWQEGGSKWHQPGQGRNPKMEAEQLRPWNVSEGSVNTEHFIVVQKAIEKIEACPEMEGIKNAPSHPARCD